MTPKVPKNQDHFRKGAPILRKPGDFLIVPGQFAAAPKQADPRPTLVGPDQSVICHAYHQNIRLLIFSLTYFKIKYTNSRIFTLVFSYKNIFTSLQINLMLVEIVARM